MPYCGGGGGSRSSGSSFFSGSSGSTSGSRSSGGRSFFQRKQKLQGTYDDDFVQQVGASRGAFIDWDSLIDDFRSFCERQRNSGSCKFYNQLLRDCAEKYGSESPYCSPLHRCIAKLSCKYEDAK